MSEKVAYWNYIVNHFSKNAYILCAQDATTFILNCVLKTILCTTKRLTYNQYKNMLDYTRLVFEGYG